jgi:hypothetical protein
MNTTERELLERCKEALIELPFDSGTLIKDIEAYLAKPIEAPCNLDGLAKLGWQAVECSICGSHAMAYPKPAQDPEWYHGIDDTGCSRFYHKDEVRPSSFGNPLYTSPQPRKHEKAEAALLSDELRLFENTCMSEKDTLRRTRIFLNTIAK